MIGICTAFPVNVNYTLVGDVQFSGHYNQSGLGYELCCTDSFTDAQEVHGAVPEDSFALHGDGHIASITEGNNLGLWLRETIGAGTCTTRAADACLVGEMDVLRMSATSNAHIGSSTDSSRPQTHAFDTSLCCEIYELCWDSVDNDGDGYVDCADPDCYGDEAPPSNSIYGTEPQLCTGSTYDTNGCAQGYGSTNIACQGPDDTFGQPQYFHCNYGKFDVYNLTAPDGTILDDASQVGVCCPQGERGRYDTFTGTWSCTPNDECNGIASPRCSYRFEVPAERDDWFLATEEVDTPNYCV
ncbi:MAG: hypothetical protein GY936_06690, partial [Ignavibacteriae bacterium]|nr:hypothetical protein [Ignavibacteriota bacterium]